MNFLLFLAILLHLVCGLLFCGLPLIACADFCKVRGIGISVARESLLHAVCFGIGSLIVGSLLAAVQWDASYDSAWSFLGKRWVFLFAEFAFSIVLISIAIWFARGNELKTGARWTAVVLLFLAATNSLYHFPSLMVLTRQFRIDPQQFDVHRSIAAYIFAPHIFSRWIHIAIAAILLSAVWHRMISSWFFHSEYRRLHKLAELESADEHTLILADQSIVQLRLIDWRGGLWAVGSVALLWLSGLVLLLSLPVLQVAQLTTIPSGKSNQMMIGIILATFVGIRCVANSTRPNRGFRVLEVCLLIATIASMIDAVDRG